MNWKGFFLGVVLGAILSFATSYFVGNRYKVTSSGPGGMITVKLDTWTGRSWMARYYVRDGDNIWYWEELKGR